jgi:hypothetical protein
MELALVADTLHLLIHLDFGSAKIFSHSAIFVKLKKTGMEKLTSQMNGDVGTRL